MPKSPLVTEDGKAPTKVPSQLTMWVMSGVVVLALMALAKWLLLNVPHLDSAAPEHQANAILSSATEPSKTHVASSPPVVQGYSQQVQYLMATFQLQEAVLRGHPLHYPLEWLQLLLPHDPVVQKALETLAPYDQAGVPNISSLVEGLIALEVGTLQGASIEPSPVVSVAGLNRLKQWMHSQIKLRRVGKEQDNHEGLTCWRDAMQAMRENDIARAVTQLAPCEGLAAAKNVWLVQAQKRLHAEEVAEHLVRYVLGLIQPSSMPLPETKLQGGEGA
jgi:hypothetical protein